MPQQFSPSVEGYLDAAAGLPLHPAAVTALTAASEDGWADPARLTGPGRRSAVLLDAARQAASEHFGVSRDELSFVPSGTHALQLAVLGTLAGRGGPHSQDDTGAEEHILVHSAVEHSAVLKAAEWHLETGGQVRVVPVDRYGRVDAEEFAAEALRPHVRAAVLQAANHEVGTRQPVAEVARLIRSAGVPLITDLSHEAVYGQLHCPADVFTADARLWGGPAGVGILIVRNGVRWRSPMPTDEAESGRSPGVPDVPGIVAAVAALRAHRATATARGAELYDLVDLLREQIPGLVAGAEVLGHPTERLPHLLTFSLLYASGEILLSELDRRGFAVSSGSSCTSDTLTPSHVLVAMGALTSGNIRISLPPTADLVTIQRFLAVLPDVASTVRADFPDPAAVPPATGEPTSNAPDLLVDSRHRRCPLPILDLARRFPAVPVGAVVTVLADDPAAASDIPAWCRLTGQEFLSATDHIDGGQAYRVRRVS